MSYNQVLNIEDIINPDDLGCSIAKKWMEWEAYRDVKKTEWTELRRYVFATDTTETSNSDLPWKNKTTRPKLCQIRDNLIANYSKSLFPKRRWLKWEADDEASNSAEKIKNITNYMNWVISRSDFKTTILKLLCDYVDYGNVITMPEWKDERQQVDTQRKVGYVGPAAKRISPLDIVFNPTTEDFKNSPKIIRSIVTIGDIKAYLAKLSIGDNKDKYQELWDYLKGIREQASQYQGDISTKDELYNVDGFDSFRAYLTSDYAELLTFYGDIYDVENDEFLQNHVITVIDRHKIIEKRPNPSFFGKPPIFHVGWRIRQDNLWAMGPLDNLVGMQYRIDHLENLKADVFDLITFPPIKVKGYVEDFEWGPFEKIYIQDDGDVEVMSPDVNALQVNLELKDLEQTMEELAGAPKQALGFRTPGEKTAYEVQQLENAASRIFQSKIEQFEEQIVEPLLNSMLEMARRQMPATEISVFDDEFKVATFETLTANDITGNGKIKPVAARHFAEQAEKVQNATNFFASNLGQDPAINVHISGLKIAQMFSDLLDWDGYEIVTPFIRLTEQSEAQNIQNAALEQTTMQAMTPSGLTPEDYSQGPQNAP